MTARWRKARARYTIRMWPSYECLTHFPCKVPNVNHVFVWVGLEYYGPLKNREHTRRCKYSSDPCPKFPNGWTFQV